MLLPFKDGHCISRVFIKLKEVKTEEYGKS